MMSAVADEIAVYGHALALAAYAAFLIYLLVSGRLRGADAPGRAAFMAALLASTLWLGLALASELAATRALEPLVTVADLLRYGLWIVFLSLLLRPRTAGEGAVPSRPPRAVQWIAGAGALALVATLVMLGLDTGMQAGPSLVQPRVAGQLALAVCGLLMVEQVFRNLSEDSRWNAKPVCLGLGGLFVFDIYLFSEALLFGRFDPDAAAVRGAAHALAVPFLFVASRRSQQWFARLQVSRAAAFYSATLILAGGYLLFMSAVGYYVRYFGGSWGRALQLGLLAAALAMLGVLIFSGSMRSWLRVFVGKHFFRLRFDYREEWLRFTAMLSSKRSPQEMGELIVRGLAKTVESPGGSL